MRRRAVRLAGTLLACTAALLSACSKPPSHAECDALLDHYVELLVTSDRPGTSAGELHKLQILARQKAESDPEFSQCSQRVSRRAYDCAMSAPNADKLEQCLL
ncbi:MAG TPA: hypothetical protein VNW92_19065 [Polyangiaceae bacterium]|jgi:hypothetical protein|nr:hypothetical protein [Polyangiaceae bacterium]